MAEILPAKNEEYGTKEYWWVFCFIYYLKSSLSAPKWTGIDVMTSKDVSYRLPGALDSSAFLAENQTTVHSTGSRNTRTFLISSVN